MAIFRCVSPNFWSDPKVDDDFTPEDKYFYLYLLTNPHTTLSGCYELGKRQASRELGYNEETVDRLIHRMETVHNVVRYDKATKEILLLNWHKYNWSKSPKCLKGVEYSLQNIKSDAFRKYCADTLSIQYRYSIDTTVSVTATVTEPITETVIYPNRDSLNNSKEKAPAADADLAQIIQRYEEVAGSFPRSALEKLQSWRQAFGTDLILLAIDRAAEANKRSWAYINGILASWQREGVRTVGDVAASDEQYQSRQQQARPGSATGGRKPAESVDDQLTRVLANMDRKRGFEQ